ncbi:MAG: DNA polymerase, partial [Thaumarchaeota archaeon]|nr:DNA polymerase [Nitrososphaerota archaeon]
MLPLQETDVKKLSEIKTSTSSGKRIQYRRNASTQKLEINGFDTETYHGFVFQICNSYGRELFKPTREELIEFLTYYKYENKWNFFYGLSYDVGAILKTIFGKDLKAYNIARKLEFKYGKYTFSYIPKKQLTIRNGKHHVIFGDIGQFYKTSLEKAYEATIGELPAEYKGFKMKLREGEFSKRFIGRNRKRIAWYCVQDSKFTKALAEAFISPFGKAFGFYPKRFLSEGFLAEKAVINNSISIPYFDSLPYLQQEFIYASSFAGRFELIKRGYIDEAYF